MGFEGASTYIDETLIEGVLAGVVLLLLASWLRFANNWFWRLSFSSTASSFFRCVTLLGLQKCSRVSGPRLTASGSLNGQEIALTMEGSFRGKRLVCKLGDNTDQFVSTDPFTGVESALTNWLSSHKRQVNQEQSPNIQRVEE